MCASQYLLSTAISGSTTVMSQSSTPYSKDNRQSPERVAGVAVGVRVTGCFCGRKHVVVLCLIFQWLRAYRVFRCVFGCVFFSVVAAGNCSGWTTFSSENNDGCKVY